ncbi:MAG: hypothetical protein RL030_305 [Pseudomonadota bacterium]|jgi:hypothetical protein
MTSSLCPCFQSYPPCRKRPAKGFAVRTKRQQARQSGGSLPLVSWRPQANNVCRFRFRPAPALTWGPSSKRTEIRHRPASTQPPYHQRAERHDTTVWKTILRLFPYTPSIRQGFPDGISGVWSELEGDSWLRRKPCDFRMLASYVGFLFACYSDPESGSEMGNSCRIPARPAGSPPPLPLRYGHVMVVAAKRLSRKTQLGEFASHARVPRTSWQGRASAPRCIPLWPSLGRHVRGVPPLDTPRRGRRPRTRFLRSDDERQ